MLAAAGLRKNTTVSAGLRTRITIRPGYARRPGTHPEKNFVDRLPLPVLEILWGEKRLPSRSPERVPMR